jgi:hypothetical protein
MVRKKKRKALPEKQWALPDGKEALISKTLLKEKKRKQHCKGSGGPLPGGTEALISLSPTDKL